MLLPYWELRCCRPGWTDSEQGEACDLCPHREVRSRGSWLQLQSAPCGCPAWNSRKRSLGPAMVSAKWGGSGGMDAVLEAGAVLRAHSPKWQVTAERKKWKRHPWASTRGRSHRMIDKRRKQSSNYFWLAERGKGGGCGCPSLPTKGQASNSVYP